MINRIMSDSCQRKPHDVFLVVFYCGSVLISSLKNSLSFESIHKSTQFLISSYDVNRCSDRACAGTDDNRTAQCLLNTAGGVVLTNQVFSSSFSPEPLHTDEHYHAEE
ncbi:hypothetical protein EVAR_26503_1 [Eumeta japonica]|uniref:Uncharacterized protein n=1 Tax=Eumeta variegata TaxID=151549 RepID=A0A4C1V7V5_EUMVA|nr:hypothetical protein EVAR_26503_1 [Eumeta japonica]